MKKLSSYRMQSYQKDFTPQPPPSRQSILFNILNTNLRANGQRGTPTYHIINVCSPQKLPFHESTTAWYIVYHAVVTNLVNRSLLHTAIFHIFRRLSQHPPKTLISNLFPGDTLIQPITHVTR